MRNLLNRDKNLLGCVCDNTEKHPPVKATFVGCSSKEKQLFSTSTCLLSISVGSRAHEGEKFYSTINLVNKTFKACDILIADTIHRHTLKLTYPKKDILTLQIKAKTLGDNWLQRNKKIYTQLKIPYNILRCDEYLNHKFFKKKLEEIDELYDADKQYSDLFKLSIEQYLNRYNNKEKNNQLNYEFSFFHCLQYLKEECAIFCLLAKKQYGFEVYPSNRSIALEATWEKLISPHYLNVLKFARIKLKTKNKKTIGKVENKKPCQLEV